MYTFCSLLYWPEALFIHSTNICSVLLSARPHAALRISGRTTIPSCPKQLATDRGCFMSVLHRRPSPYQTTWWISRSCRLLSLIKLQYLPLGGIGHSISAPLPGAQDPRTSEESLTPAVLPEASWYSGLQTRESGTGGFPNTWEDDGTRLRQGKEDQHQDRTRTRRKAKRTHSDSNTKIDGLGRGGGWARRGAHGIPVSHRVTERRRAWS